MLSPAVTSHAIAQYSSEPGLFSERSESSFLKLDSRIVDDQEKSLSCSESPSKILFDMSFWSEWPFKHFVPMLNSDSLTDMGVSKIPRRFMVSIMLLFYHTPIIVMRYGAKHIKSILINYSFYKNVQYDR